MAKAKKIGTKTRRKKFPDAKAGIVKAVPPLTDGEVAWLRAFIGVISGAAGGGILFTEDAGVSILAAAAGASHVGSGPGTVNSGLPYMDPV